MKVVLLSPLTTGADALSGGTGIDKFVATEATLSSGDVLNGGAGTDNLNYTASGTTGAINESGFTSTNIENVNVTSDVGFLSGANGVDSFSSGTTFDMTGVDGVTTVTNVNSSTDVTFVGLETLPAVGVSNVGGAGAISQLDGTPDTSFVFDAAAVAGAADELTLNLSDNKNIDGSGVGDISVNGIETVNVMSADGASLINSVISPSLSKMTVKGDADLTIASQAFAATIGVNTLDASSFTGGLNVTLANSGAVDVAVTGGTGADTADFSNGFDADDAFDGGDGVDTLGLTNVVATGTPAGTVSNVEQLNVTTAGTGTIDMDNFSGISKVIYDKGIVANGTATVDDAVTGTTVEVDVANLVAADASLVVDLKTDGAADELTIALDDIDAGEGLASIDAADAETLNISADDDTATGTGTLTIASLTASDATTLKLSGDADLTITNTVDPATAVLATVDASAATGKVSISGTDFAASGATVTLGSGDDMLNLATAAGADTITLGEGKDTVTYTAVAQSGGAKVDTITDFKSGTDVINVDFLLGGAAVASSSKFVGNFSNFGAAQGALPGGGVAPANTAAVFDSSTGTLWVDNGDGTLDANDLQVKLTGVTALTAADLGFGTGETFTAKVNGFNTAVAAHSVENKAVGNEDDTINATVAQINTGPAAIDGLGGTDVLNISGTAAAGEVADLKTAALTAVETVNIDSSVEGVSVDNADFKGNGGAVATINGVSGTIQSLTVDNASNLIGTAINNVEGLVLDTAATTTVVMSAAQHAGFGSIIGARADDTIDITGASATSSVNANASIESYNITNAGVLELTLSAAGQNIGSEGSTTTTLVLDGNVGAFTGDFNTQFEGTQDTLRLINSADISGLNNSGAGADGFTVLDLNNQAQTVIMTDDQHQALTTVNNATNAQNFTISTAGAITARDGIESYGLVGGSAVTVNAAETGVNIGASNAGVTTVNVGGNTVTGVYALSHGADAISATDGADITGVNGGASTTAEALTLAGEIKMTAAQLGDFAGTVTAAGTNDKVSVTTSGNHGAVDADVENWDLDGAGADTITIGLADGDDGTTNGQASVAVSLAGGGADVVTIANVTVDDTGNIAGTSDDLKLVNITDFLVADDKISVQETTAGVSTNGVFSNNADAAAIGALTVNSGDIVEIDAASFQMGTPSNVDALSTFLTASTFTFGAAGGEIATVIAYDGNGTAAIYQVEDAAGGGAFVAADTIELVGTVNAADNALTAFNFA